MFQVVDYCDVVIFGGGGGGGCGRQQDKGEDRRAGGGGGGGGSGYPVKLDLVVIVVELMVDGGDGTAGV